MVHKRRSVVIPQNVTPTSMILTSFDCNSQFRIPFPIRSVRQGENGERAERVIRIDGVMGQLDSGWGEIRSNGADPNNREMAVA